MKRTSSVLWGTVLIALGIIFALYALDIVTVNLFFDGWWTLFIIIPCAIGLVSSREKTGNIIGIVIGVFLLLCCQDILSFRLLWKLLIPAIIIIIGIKMVFGGFKDKKSHKIIDKMKEKGVKPTVGCATFSGCNMNFDGQVFEGAELTAVFGSVECDLRNADIPSDCVIQVCAVFGGINILVPENVNVKVNSTSIFGGVSNKTKLDRENTVTVYVSGLCMFGGVDIK